MYSRIGIHRLREAETRNVVLYVEKGGVWWRCLIYIYIMYIYESSSGWSDKSPVINRSINQSSIGMRYLLIFHIEIWSNVVWRRYSKKVAESRIKASQSCVVWLLINTVINTFVCYTRLPGRVISYPRRGVWWAWSQYNTTIHRQGASFLSSLGETWRGSRWAPAMASRHWDLSQHVVRSVV